MKLSSLLLTCFAFPAIAMAGITTSGSVLTRNGGIYGGSDPWVISDGALNIGTSAIAGSVEVTSGSALNVSSQINVTSPTSGSKSSLLVDGSGSSASATSSIFLDGGLLRVTNGASVDVGDLGSRSQDGLTAQTFIEGAGTIFNTDSLGFGGNGESQISVSNGARLVSQYVQGWNDGSSFSITIGGGSNTSQWFQNGSLTMGRTGNDLIDIRGGGLVRVEGGSLSLGFSSEGFSGSGTIRVDGTDGSAELQLLVSPSIGRSGTGNLVVTNGGKVIATNNFIGIGDSHSGGSGTLSIGGGEKVSFLEGKPSLSLSGAASLIEVLANGFMDTGGIRVTDGARVIVGGGSGSATLNLSPGAFTFPNNGELFVTGGSRVDVRQGGTISAATFSVSEASSQVSLDGGTLKGAGYLGGLPVQILAGGGTIQAGIGGFTLSATTGVGLLAKTGAGSMTFAGQTNHAGTRVVEGSLNLAAGSRTTGTVEILAGAKLTGTGTLDGLLTLQQGAVIAPGNSPGILQTGASVWMSGGRYEWEINNALGNRGIHWDLVQINGSLDLVGLSPSDPFVIALRSLFESTDNAGLATNFDSQSNYRFTILTTTSGITGFDPSDFRLDLTGFANADLGDAYWALQEWNNGLDLVYNFAPVPEPGSAIFIAVTALAALTQRRRR